MAAFRFRLRSLVLLVVFLAMACAVGVLTVQNRGLRIEVEQTRAEARSAQLRAELERLIALEEREIARKVATKGSAGKP
jgi:hypothetical protein